MDLRRVSHAGGVAQADAGDARRFHEAAAPVKHGGGAHLAVHGATEAARQRQVQRDTGVFGDGCHGSDGIERLRLRHAQIAQVMGFGGRHHHVQLVGARCDGALRTHQIGHQRAVNHTRAARDFVHHDLGVFQCRNGQRRYKRRHFNARQTALRQGIDQRNFVFGGDKLRLRLQAVACTDFLHFNAAFVTVPKLCHAITFLSLKN